MKPSERNFYLGKSIDGLSLKDRTRLNGCWIATELYSPKRLPLRIMAAVGTNVRDCVLQLRERGLDPTHYHYEAV